MNIRTMTPLSLLSVKQELLDIKIALMEESISLMILPIDSLVITNGAKAVQTDRIIDMIESRIRRVEDLIIEYDRQETNT